MQIAIEVRLVAKKELESSMIQPNYYLPVIKLKSISQAKTKSKEKIHQENL